jgi:hypothetical protein
MKLFRIAGVAVAAAALAACGGATEENVATTDNITLETENLDVGADLNATDLNTLDANALDANSLEANTTDNAANAADNATNAL